MNESRVTDEATRPLRQHPADLNVLASKLLKQASELLDELRILLEKLCELPTLLLILLSQRFQW